MCVVLHWTEGLEEAIYQKYLWVLAAPLTGKGEHHQESGHVWDWEAQGRALVCHVLLWVLLSRIPCRRVQW